LVQQTRQKQSVIAALQFAAKQSFVRLRRESSRGVWICAIAHGPRYRDYQESSSG
jgi:hypothetical protein